MRHAVLNVFLPILALGGILFFVAYPEPQDANLVSVSLQLTSAPAEADKDQSYVRTLFETESLPSAAPQLAHAHASGCLDGLANATAERRAECAPVIVEALAAIDAAAGRGLLRTAPGPSDPVAIEQRIMIAATEVCRADWLQRPDDPTILQSPICTAANVRLVSNTE